MGQIIEVVPVLYKGKALQVAKQLVAFRLEGRENVFFISYDRLKKLTGIEIGCVEILKGSVMNPKFYPKGFVMPNNQVCKSDNMVESFEITMSGSVDEMLNNYDGDLPSRRIRKVFTCEGRRGKRLVGFDIGEEKAVFEAFGSLKAITGLDEEDVDILTGSYIAPEYYQSGEEMWDGSECRVSNVLLKNLNLRFNGSVEEMRKNRPEPEVDDSWDGQDGDDDWQDDTDWSHYNDDLDMDQQSPEFWNQF